MENITIGVGDLIRFVYASGNLEPKQKNHQAKHDGQFLHAKHQKDYHPSDQKEAFIQANIVYKAHKFLLSGRIDGILKRDQDVIIEEIKTTETNLDLIDVNTYPMHLAQAQLYAHMYIRATKLTKITIRLTYIHRIHETKKTIEKTLSKSTLQDAFETIIEKYIHWTALYQEHQYEKEKSLQGLQFPYEHLREGQHEFMAAVYKTMIEKDILYAQAPTGIGKTIAALYASLKTLKNDREKIFYCTAKNAGKTIAVDTMQYLKDKGLIIKAITLNSKDNMCLRDEVDCDPDICPFARGFYNRLNQALEDIFVHDDVYHLTLIKQYAAYHKICPHEFALEISRYCDVIICDYNYVFDPRIQLMRYFEETTITPKLLVDEAHNLIDRSRQMFSASLSLSTLYQLKSEIKPLTAAIKTPLKRLIDTLETLMQQQEVKKSGFVLLSELDSDLLRDLQALLIQMETFLSTHKKHKLRKVIKEHYFELLSFSRISEYFNDDYRIILSEETKDYSYHLVCLDTSFAIKALLDDRVSATIFFSATLSPSQYFASLLTQGEGQKFSIPTPFDPKRLGLYIDVSTSTKYRDRHLSIERIVDNIYALLESRQGHYIVFFPSYTYMHQVLEKFDGQAYDVYVQSRDMNHHTRQVIIDAFKSSIGESKVLFSVLGGSFSEGIDYLGDMLHGVMIVGVALPQYNRFNEMLKDHYYSKGYDGFHYAYTFPGMNKVIQAVGRVIRTKADKGVAILLDQRYQTPIYQTLMPPHWSHAEYLQLDDYLQGYLNQFWQPFNRKKK